jgi:hypothetical protein
MGELTAWHDYFVTVGGGAAALAGLVFVAMTLHLDEIRDDPAHRHRARAILTGMTAVFVRCALALMGGQSARAVAAELIAVLAAVEAALYWSLRQAEPGASGWVRLRTAGGAACLLLEQAGAVLLLSGVPWGLYAVGVGMLASFAVTVSGAWLLLVGVGARRPRPMERAGAPRGPDRTRSGRAQVGRRRPPPLGAITAGWAETRPASTRWPIGQE